MAEAAIVKPTEDVKLDSHDPEEVKSRLLAKYPPKVARKRSKQIVVNKVGPDGKVPVIGSNVRTVPGLMGQRGCCYAGCKGVVLGPTRDIINITHGPIGCGYYSWLTRRNQTDPSTTPDGHNFMPYCFSTDMQDQEIIFGGEKKLKQAIQEAYDNFKPKAISVFSTCPGGSHRRRHSLGLPRNEGQSWASTYSAFPAKDTRASARAPATISPTTEFSSTWSGLDDDHQGRKIQDQPPGRIQHRRRRVRDRKNLSSKCGITTGVDLQRQLQHRRVRQLPYRRFEPASCATAPSTTWLK